MRRPTARRDPDAVLRFCSLMLALGCVSRASSYALRPPGPANPSSSVLEAGVGYDRWTVILLITATLILLGTFRRPCWPARFVGHLLGLFCSSTFALSIIVASVANDASWSGAAPLVILATLHGGLVIHVAESRGRR